MTRTRTPNRTQAPTPVDVPGITTPDSPYPSATRWGDTLHVSGQVAFDESGAIAHEGDIRGQVRCTLDRLGRVLAHFGAGPGSVAAATVYITDASYAVVLNEEWSAWFAGHRPARATVVAGLLDPRLLVEITAVCSLDSTGKAAAV
ncbi:RidA family protein [Streptomyces sp. NPDC005349]|uniref:RidA family protein n=1 Tax=Streptomyces sp. NPDC005349 TaxID=3157037 RepID=UPI0033B48139